MEKFERYEQLLQQKAYEELTPQEQALAETFGGAESYTASRAALLALQQHLQHNGAKPSAGLQQRLRRQLPRRLYSFSALGLVSAAILLLTLGTALGYTLRVLTSPDPAPQAPAEPSVKYATIHDTIYLDRIVEKTIKVIERVPTYKSPQYNISPKTQDTAKFASQPKGRSLKEDADLLRFVDRRGI